MPDKKQFEPICNGFYKQVIKYLTAAQITDLYFTADH